MQPPTPPPQNEKDHSIKTQSVEIDFAYYDRYLTDYDISDDQKRDLIAAIANIMMAFVDLGFGVAPGQISAESLSAEDKNPPEIPDNLLYSASLSKSFKPEKAARISAAKGCES